MTPAPDLLTPLDQFRAVCENATVALFVMDARQHCIYMNASAEALTGYTLDEVRGKPLHDFVHHSHPDGRPYPVEDCPIDRAAPQNMQERGEELFVHKDGHFYPVAFTASPIRGDSGVIGTVIEVRDLAPEKQRQREDEAMQQLAETMLHELDLSRLVQAVTDTATRLTGAQFGAFFYNVVGDAGEAYMLYSLSGVPAEHFSKFPHPRATPMFGPTFRGEGTIRLDDVLADPRYGQWGPHHGMPPGHLPVRSYLAVPVKSDTGEVLGGLFFGSDRVGVFTRDHERVVEAIAAQSAVGMSRLRAFQAAAAEAREKERLYNEALRAGQMKDQFLATISHELRTPLTSILGWAEMLASGRLTPEMSGRAVASIARNARAQAQIIEDLLDISRIVSGKLHLDVRSIDAAQPVEAAVDAMRPAALARGVHLSLSVAPDVGMARVDPDRLQQVVWNLVANAVKFTGRDGRVDVEMTRPGGTLTVRVRDTGRGIERAFLPHLFERFSQGDPSSTREHGGLGLGLSIVRHLVELHGGTVQAESDGPGHGATFTVRLPENEEAVQTPAQPLPMPHLEPRPVHGAGSLHDECVLLVEDDADTRNLLASVLEAAGARVELAASSAEALATLEHVRPTLVISDIGMPGMDGYAFIAAMRDRERARGEPVVPAIALTAFARDEDRLRALEHGFQLHVAKPVHPAELVSAARELLGLSDR